MIKWEYLRVINAQFSTIVDYGEQGWELCGIDNSIAPHRADFYFKRPKPGAKIKTQMEG